MLGLSRMFSGKGTTSVQSNVKNPQLQQEWSRYLGGFQDLGRGGQDLLRNYQQSYAQFGMPRAQQEAGAIDPIYSGRYASDLQRLSADQTAGERSMLDMLGRQVQRQQSSSLLGGGGGGGSYRARALAGALAPYYTQAAAAEAGRNRGNYDAVLQAQLANAGRRQAITDQALMAPEMLRRQMYGQELGMLGQLGQLDQANKFYGLKYKPTGLERFSEGADVAHSQLLSSY